MAPAAKKAKVAEKPVAGGGLTKFFGSTAKAAVAAPTLAATPAPAPAAAPVAQPEARPVATPQTSQPSQPSQGSLSDEMRQRIEENRRKALEKKRAREEASTQQAPEAPKPESAEPAPAAADPAPAAKAEETKPAAKAKAKGKAAAKGAAKAKAKAAPKVQATPDKVTSPERPATGAPRPSPNVAETTPEKTVAPSQEKARPSAAEPREPGKFDRMASGQWMEYNSLYAARLRQLRGPVFEQARALWGGMLEPSAFKSELTGYRQGSQSHEAVLVGIVFRHLKERPCVIELYQKNKIGGVPTDELSTDAPKLCSESDEFFLEDAVMRVKLEIPGELRACLATGFVVAVRGYANPEGGFSVTGLCFARMPAPPALPAAEASSGAAPHVAFVSGLTAAPEGGAKEELVAARAKCAEFLTSGSVQHVVVCGGTLPGLGKDNAKEALDEADSLLAVLAEKVSVHVMPGRGDPTSMSLPQMPLHPHLFRRVQAHKQNFNAVSNPHNCSLGGVKVMGHSGQPVQDLMRCTQMKTPLEALMVTLEALHLAPTAPDTLATQPFAEADPFIIDEVPHVLFAGGCDRAAHEWRPASRGEGGTTCICVPAFHKQPAAVLVNLHDPKDIKVQEFGTAGDVCMG